MLAIWGRITGRLFERSVARLQRRTSSRRALRVGRRLVALGRFEEADAVLATALASNRGCPDLLDTYALSAHDSGRYRLSLDRWEALREVDPNRPRAWTGIAANQRKLEELGAAEATIRQALDRFPDDLVVVNEAARLFDRIGAPREAVAHWSRLCAHAPEKPEWLQGHAFSLILLGDFAAAEAVLERAVVHHPNRRDLLGTRAFLETERGNWNGALSLWRTFRECWPDDQTGWEGQGRTIAAMHAARAEGIDVSADIVPTDIAKVDIEVVEDETTRALMLGFESIGADCEFGLVQRRFGAEPLGLLRFNDVGLSNLMAALAADFADMGAPHHTAMMTSSSGEFYVTDTRWGLGMHTFMFASRHEATALLPKMCRRVAYLRDKLLADLRDGRKTFVFKSDAIDLDGLHAMHRALRAVGPVRLLHVRRASVPLTDRLFDVAPGEVALLEPDLYVGFLSRFGNAGFAWDIAFDEWVSICNGLDAARALPHLSI